MLDINIDDEVKADSCERLLASFSRRSKDKNALTDRVDYNNYKLAIRLYVEFSKAI